MPNASNYTRKSLYGVQFHSVVSFSVLFYLKEGALSLQDLSSNISLMWLIEKLHLFILVYNRHKSSGSLSGPSDFVQD